MTAYNGNQFIIKPEAVNELSKLELGLVNYVGASHGLHTILSIITILEIMDTSTTGDQNMESF